MVVKSGKHELVGFVDLGTGHDIMLHLSGNTVTLRSSYLDICLYVIDMTNYFFYQVVSGKHVILIFCKMLHILGKLEPGLATQVLQFVFLSDCGFRFPVAQFPSGSCSPSDLYFLFWEGVLKMMEEGFT